MACLFLHEAGRAPTGSPITRAPCDRAPRRHPCPPHLPQALAALLFECLVGGAAAPQALPDAVGLIAGGVRMDWGRGDGA
jgi:hypothetical protein